MRLITHKEVIGQLANWAIRQHPYGRPEGLFDVADCITSAAIRSWTIGPDSLKMMEVENDDVIEGWLRDTLANHPVLNAWNTPRSERLDTVVFTSRHGGPNKQDDFIDIDALLRNVAMSTWRQSGEE